MERSGGFREDETGTVVGAGLRAAPFEPCPLFLLPMPDDAAVALAHRLHERGEAVLAVNGALPAAQLCAAQLARLAGGRLRVGQHTRLHELGDPTPPAPVPGGLRAATEDDLELAVRWFGAFMGDADEQAGRPRGASAHEVPERTELLGRIRAGRGVFTDLANPTSNRIYAALGFRPVVDMANLLIVR